MRYKLHGVSGLMAAALIWPTLAAAGADPDPRIKRVDDPSGIIELQGCIGFQTVVYFGNGERIEYIGVGDDKAWKAMPNQRGNLLTVRPMSAGVASNAAIQTNWRTYRFALNTASGADCAAGNVPYAIHLPQTQR